MKKLISVLLILQCFSVTAQTLDEVKEEIINKGIKHPDIVLRQVIWETGWLECTNCSRDYNNLFGFFYKGDYLSWETWEESVDYYKWWQDKLYNGGDYYQFLINIHYASDSEAYVEHLKSLEF